jgi:PAS domain S-box-containing protein
MNKKLIQKILSVDDNPENNFLIKSFLQGEGVEILMAESGQEALGLIEGHHFCLFVLDVMMPMMSGFELIKKIRQKQEYEFVPIILITGIYSDSLNVFKGYESGAIDYLVKPVQREILSKKVDYFLALDRQKHEITDQRNKLQISQKRFYDIAWSIADWIWEIDSNDNYIYVSERIKEVMGFDSLELIGRTPYDLMPQENIAQIKSKFETIKSNAEPINDLVNWNITKSGKLVCILTNGVPIFDEENKLLGYRGVDKDITAKVKYEQNLHFQAKLLQNVNDSIIYTDLGGVIKYVNNGTEFNFGHKSDDLIGKTLSALFPEQYKDLSKHDLFVVIESKSYEAVWQGKNKKGELIWLDVKINLMKSKDGQPEGYIIVSNDITLRKKAEDGIVLSLITGEDNERKRLASDLHDSLGQILTASSYNLNAIKNEVKTLDPKKQEQYNAGLSLLNKGIEEIRNVAHNLMPKAIEHFGLLSAITSLFNSVKKTHDIEIMVNENIGNTRYNQQFEINMYRISQEILNNALKHAKANKIIFQYQVFNNELIFIYEDDGIGFDYDKKKLKGEGLNNIANRVMSMSGFLSINSKVGKGTSISIEITL